MVPLACLFVAATGCQGGVVGAAPPSLAADQLDAGARPAVITPTSAAVYAASCSAAGSAATSAAVLGETFEPLPLLKKS